MITGAESGQIIYSKGTVKKGFDFQNSYNAHNCSVNSIILFDNSIISSDDCGYIVQYDLEKEVVLDHAFQPDFGGNKNLFLTNFLDGNIGASMKKDTKSIYLYKADKKIAS